MEKQNQNKSTEITTAEVKAIAFKSPELTAATERIAAAIKSTVAGRREACVEFARIERDKLYKSDGFKSLAEYAERIGIDKSLAHKLENAGRLMISDNITVKQFASNADYSKLSMLASVKEDELATAIKGGEISPESTQAEVTEWKRKARDSKTVKILKRYDIHYTEILAKSDPTAEIFQLEGRNTTFMNTAVEEVEQIRSYIWARAKLDGDNIVFIGINPATGAIALYRLAPATKPTLKDRANQNLREKLAAMDPAELAELLASITGKTE